MRADPVPGSATDDSRQDRAGGSHHASPKADPVFDRLERVLAPDFRLLRPLGEGAVALVYLACETALERLVAVKVLRPELASDRVVRRRFSREARAAARIVHPNVVAVHRVGELADGSPYLIMEYVEGRTLADLLAADGPLGPDPGRAALEQIAGALTAAHQKGIIHRDVRPGNIIIEHDTHRMVLTDFGLSGIKETGSELITRLTRAGEVLGDPGYTSPEQLLGEPVTEATDLYSFGIVGYEIVSGSTPFGVTTARETVIAHVKHAPRGLRDLRTDAPVELARLLERCLAKKPEHRPRAADVRAALAAMTPQASTAPAAHSTGDAGLEHEPPFFPALASFLAELKRRRVYRAAVAYLAVAFVALQGADIIFAALPLPAWGLSALVGLLLAGFPIVLVLTWIFDLNRSGIERTTDADSAALLPGERLARRILQLLGIVLSVAVVSLLVWWMLE